MKNVFLTFILLVFLAPAGNVFSQTAAIVTFANPREALAYNELSRICELVRQNADYFDSLYRNGGEAEKQLAVKRRLNSWGGYVDNTDIAWVNTIAQMVFIEKKSSSDIYINCMGKGKALHVDDKKRINNILAGKTN